MAIVALVLACLLTWWVEKGGLPVSRCFLGLLAVMVRARFVEKFIEHRCRQVYIFRAVPVDKKVDIYSLVDLVMLLLGDVERHVESKVVFVVDEFDWWGFRGNLLGALIFRVVRHSGGGGLSRALWGRALRGRSEDQLSRFGSPTGRGERVLALVVTMVNVMWVA